MDPSPTVGGKASDPASVVSNSGFPQKTGLEFPYEPVMALLGIWLSKDLGTVLLITVLSITVQQGDMEKPKYPATGNKLGIVFFRHDGNHAALKKTSCNLL